MEYDVIIIGGGPAGATASNYICRAGFKTLIITNNKSSIEKAEKIENYYGFKNEINGKDLYNNGIEQSKRLGAIVVENEVIGIKYSKKDFNRYEIIVANQRKDEKYESEFVLIATGVNRNKPNIRGLDEFEGKGVSYCAVCDGTFYRGKSVAVLGSGEYALGEIEELKPIAKSIKMLTNGLKPVLNRSEDIEIEEGKIKLLRGNTKVEEIEYEDGTIEKIDGLFVAQGVASSVDLAKKIGAKILNNSIYVDENMQTNVNNIYACGDCTGGILQITKAAYEGMVAGFSIIKKLRGYKKDKR